MCTRRSFVKLQEPKEQLTVLCAGVFFTKRTLSLAYLLAYLGDGYLQEFFITQVRFF